MSDDLESYIHRQATAGENESEGVFTMTPEKALEKLSRFQLPFRGAWILKVVQAAVSSGAELLDAHCAFDTVEMLFQPPSDWSVEQLELAFYQPEKNHPPGLQHFLQALWGVMGEGLEFCVELRGEFFEWKGRVSKGRSLSGERLCMTVRHRGLYGQLLTLISERAYTCPIPFRVDGKRIDVLQNSPRCGWKQETRALFASPVECSLPRWPLPPGSFEATTAGQARVLRCPPSVGCFVLVCAHLKNTPDQSPRWTQARSPSRCYFLLDGVVVEEVAVPVSARSLSLHVFVSAEGIPTDASNLQLRMPQKGQRMLDAVTVATAALDGFQPCLHSFIAGHRPSVAPLGYALGAGGLLLLPLSRFAFLALGAMGWSLAQRKGDKADRERVALAVLLDWKPLRLELEEYLEKVRRPGP